MDSSNWNLVLSIAYIEGVHHALFEKVSKHDSQEVFPFPASDHSATRNRHNSTTHTNMKHN